MYQKLRDIILKDMIHIFMAEDDPLMISIYDKAFKLNGFEMKMAMDGEKAIETLSSIDPKPEIVLLDIMMPKKTGFDVITFMKADANLKNIPVIVLTNLSSREDTEKVTSLGADLCLTKSHYGPIDTVKMVQEVYNKHYKKN
jgi:DNA-binding response OmpR family regulator